MKVEQPDTDWKPVVITIETRKELRELVDLLDHTDFPRPGSAIAQVLRGLIRKLEY